MSLWYTADWIRTNMPISNRQDKGVRAFTGHLPLQPGALETQNPQAMFNNLTKSRKTQSQSTLLSAYK